MKQVELSETAKQTLETLKNGIEDEFTKAIIEQYFILGYNCGVAQ